MGNPQPNPKTVFQMNNVMDAVQRLDVGGYFYL